MLYSSPSNLLFLLYSLVRSVQSQDEKLLAAGLLTKRTFAGKRFAENAFVRKTFQGGMFIKEYRLEVIMFVLIYGLEL